MRVGSIPPGVSSAWKRDGLPRLPNVGRVEFKAVSKSYDGMSDVVDRLGFTIEPGEFLTLLGPSGSGKTTTLMMLAGFEQPTSGDITLEDRSILALPPHARNFGMVFQNYALFPHLSVAANIAFPLTVRKRPRAEVAERVTQALEMVRLANFGSRFPAQLSGGQQQRVALARALVFEPRLVLMDEPLGALDKRLREEMQAEIRHLHQALGVTMVYVTHDQVEAMALSDRVAVLQGGRIRQLGSPRIIREAPADGFVAKFVGDTNAMLGTVEGASNSSVRLRLDDGILLIGRSPDPVQPGQRKLASVRPERIRLDPPPTLENVFEGIVEDAMYLGDRVSVTVRLPSGLPLSIDLGIGGLDLQPAPGHPTRVGWASDHCLVLDPD
jgi:putative spermidine/putrescine transport system ATP-binding protein